jgi:hypothetical protein
LKHLKSKAEQSRVEQSRVEQSREREQSDGWVYGWVWMYGRMDEERKS